jgi:hypothetical protein
MAIRQPGMKRTPQSIGAFLTTILLSVCFFFSLARAGFAGGQTTEKDSVPGELVVKLKERFDLSALEELNQRFGVTSVTEIFPKQLSPQERLARAQQQHAELEAQEHQAWYWWADKASPEYGEYMASIEAQKQALGAQINAHRATST